MDEHGVRGRVVADNTHLGDGRARRSLQHHECHGAQKSPSTIDPCTGVAPLRGAGLECRRRLRAQARCGACSDPSRRGGTRASLHLYNGLCRLRGMPRKTLQRTAVLNAFLREPCAERFGLEIAKEAGLASGTIYPILARLEADGWVTSSWEDIDESTEGRRRRRNYRLTAAGAKAARTEVAEVQRRVSPEPKTWIPGVLGLIGGTA